MTPNSRLRNLIETKGKVLFAQNKHNEVNLLPSVSARNSTARTAAGCYLASVEL